MDARASKPWRPNLKRRVAALFKEIDADGDGTLSRAEVAQKLLEDTELQAIMESVLKGMHTQPGIWRASCQLQFTRYLASSILSRIGVPRTRLVTISPVVRSAPLVCIWKGMAKQ